MIKGLKLFALMVLLFSTGQCFAQVRFGLKAGLNLANILDKDNNGTYSSNYNLKTGIQVGVTAEFPVSKAFSIEPGLLYSQKGFFKPVSASAFDGLALSSAEIRATFSYLEIPVNAVYKINLRGSKLIINGGPFLGYAISGKLKATEAVLGDNLDQKEYALSIGNKESNDLKPLDYGLNLGAGIEMNDLTFGIQYGLSLANIAPVNNQGWIIKNKVIGFSAGYKFGGKK
jgi:hypothetical protein